MQVSQDGKLRPKYHPNKYHHMPLYYPQPLTHPNLNIPTPLEDSAKRIIEAF